MNRSLLLIFTLFAAHAGAVRPYRGGAVAAAHPAATQAGLEMLQRGGNAVDAAVAAAFVMGVVGPYHSGLGGGGFALVHRVGSPKTKEGPSTRVLDFREVAPQAASRDMYLREGKLVPGLSTDGALAVAVPGAARGYLELLSTYGKLKPSVVLRPAIRAAKEGFGVTPQYQRFAQRRLECLRADAEARRIFLRPDRTGAFQPPKLGTVLAQPELAKTLELLAERGAQAFYRGRVAQAIATTVEEGGGVLTMKDLERYHTTWREPLVGQYRGHRLATMPPPSAGGVTILQVLGALEMLGPAGEGGLASRQVPVLHRYIEALRRAYVDRARFLGDPAFVQVPVAQLTSSDYLAKLVRGIDPKRATPSQGLMELAKTTATSSEVEPKNTTHLSVIDREGNAVALTTTVNYWFGSCVVARGTGVLLNNEMDDFAAQPMVPNLYGVVTGESNAIAPGKIPLSSMSPTLVFTSPSPSEPERVLLAVGSPGGSTIPTTVIQVISHVLDQSMDVGRAVGFGRIHHQWLPDAVTVDPYALEPETARALEAMGHTLRRVEDWGDAQAVFRHPSTGLVSAASDPRNEGFANGHD